MTIVGYTCVLAGGERFEFKTLCGALQAVRRLWPLAFFQGDGSRVLAWPSKAERDQDDEGWCAVATIRPATFAERVAHYADHITAETTRRIAETVRLETIDTPGAGGLS